MSERVIRNPDFSEAAIKTLTYITYLAALYGIFHIIGLAINHIGTIYGPEVDDIEYGEGEEYYEKINTCHQQ
ncbi:MAG: hypothetical protein ACE5F4_02815 [Candidatus Paceibacteria bacterium]